MPKKKVKKIGVDTHTKKTLKKKVVFTHTRRKHEKEYMGKVYTSFVTLMLPPPMFNQNCLSRWRFCLPLYQYHMELYLGWQSRDAPLWKGGLALWISAASFCPAIFTTWSRLCLTTPVCSLRLRLFLVVLRGYSVFTPASKPLFLITPSMCSTTSLRLYSRLAALRLSSDLLSCQVQWLAT